MYDNMYFISSMMKYLTYNLKSDNNNILDEVTKGFYNDIPKTRNKSFFTSHKTKLLESTSMKQKIVAIITFL